MPCHSTPSEPPRKRSFTALPLELCREVLHYVLADIGLYQAVRLRSVCSKFYCFETYISHQKDSLREGCSFEKDGDRRHQEAGEWNALHVAKGSSIVLNTNQRL